MTRPVDTLIVGASAAGLATAACLKESGQQFEVLEASDVVGQAWIYRACPLSRAPEAIGYMTEGDAEGKVVITV
jgi:cation diffusion facilitator CzcD-associated flavoprotein CzcO